MKIGRKTKELLFIIVAVVFGLYMTLAGVQALSLVRAYKLNVDGVVWAIVDDQAKLKSILENYKLEFSKNIPSDQIISTKFIQDVKITDGWVDKKVLNDYPEVETKVRSLVKDAQYYVVVKGDSLWAIVEKTGILLSDLFKYNPNLMTGRIYTGSKVLMVPQDPALDVVIQVTKTQDEPIQYATQYIKDASLFNYQRIVVQAGKNGLKNVTYNITYQNGYVTEETVIQEKTLLNSLGSIVKVGTKRTLTRLSDSNFGVVKGRLSSNFGRRIDPFTGKSGNHSGIDISTSYGSPIYAYAEGTVIQAGWDNLKGNYVTLKHGGGLSTSYLHMSKILVRVGQAVKVGEKIGQVGSTGYSTGNHLHFAVIKNGTFVSPWDYI